MCVRACACVRVYVCMYAWMYVCMYVGMYVLMYVFTYALIYVCMYLRMYIYMCVCVCVCAHAKYMRIFGIRNSILGRFYLKLLRIKKLFPLVLKTKDLATQECVANLGMKFSGLWPRAILKPALFLLLTEC